MQPTGGNYSSEIPTKYDTQAKSYLFDPCTRGRKEHEDQHVMQEYAAMMIMTLLYSARAARFDLLRPCNFLAKRITRWDTQCDQRLHRLMCFVYTTVEERMAGFIADDPKDLNIHLACDSDFAGCPYTLRSTSGHHLDIQGPNTRMALSAGSNQQTATAQSSTEAELVSLAHGIKEKGGPAITIWSKLLAHYHRSEKDWKLVIRLHEDNNAAVNPNNRNSAKHKKIEHIRRNKKTKKQKARKPTIHKVCLGIF